MRLVRSANGPRHLQDPLVRGAGVRAPVRTRWLSPERRPRLRHTQHLEARDEDDVRCAGLALDRIVVPGSDRRSSRVHPIDRGRFMSTLRGATSADKHRGPMVRSREGPVVITEEDSPTSTTFDLINAARGSVGLVEIERAWLNAFDRSVISSMPSEGTRRSQASRSEARLRAGAARWFCRPVRQHPPRLRSQCRAQPDAASDVRLSGVYHD